jgi:hypothetical protein
MGGAFVAVATDSTATWWNPAALAAGPFLDASIGRSVTDLRPSLPARRDRTSWFTFASPPFGVSYYRLRLTEAGAASPTGQDRANRQAEGDVPLRSLSVTQLGVTLVQTLVPGVHLGATLKYVRGTLREPGADGANEPEELLDAGEAASGGDAQSRFDLDVGLMATAGPIRLGGVVRNLRQPEFTATDDGAGMRLPRQVRLGAAFDAEQVSALPLTLSIDADVRSYATATGDRKVVAVGAEQWLFGHRFALRGGGRFNTVGGRERAGTAGASVAVRSGLYLEGHLVTGGTADERGWGADARVSF